MAEESGRFFLHQSPFQLNDYYIPTRLENVALQDNDLWSKRSSRNEWDLE